MRGRRIRVAPELWLAAIAACLLPGCASLRAKSWQAPSMALPVTAPKLSDGGDVSLAETWYAEAVRLDGAGSATAVDAYLQCAVAAWPAVESLSAALPGGSAAGGSPIPAGVQDSREWKLYHSAVVGLITSAQKWGRWSPQTGLLVVGPRGLAPLETAYQGFTWAPTEFGSLQCVGVYRAPQPERIHRRDGVRSVPNVRSFNLTADSPPLPWFDPCGRRPDRRLGLSFTIRCAKGSC